MAVDNPAPGVTQRITQYRQIKFEAGETVFVEAHGCVNTVVDGWKRYVDPAGGSTDRYYHGLIWIPQARIMHEGALAITPVGTSLVRISSVSPDSGKDSLQSQELIIGNAARDTSPQMVAAPDSPQVNAMDNWLRLGYEINPQDTAEYNYTGTPVGQGCEASQKAVVTVSITKRTVGNEPSRQLRSFDPVSVRADPNGFMESPNWYGNSGKLWPPGSGLPQDTKLEALKECLNFQYIHPFWRVQNGVHFVCTQQASLDVPISKFNTCLLEPGFGELHGHVDWVPVTYIGKIRFRDFSPDGDLDLQLYDFTDEERTLRFRGNGPEGRVAPILTQDSQDDEDYRNALWLEFGGYEVTEHFVSPNDDLKDNDWLMFVPAKPEQEEKHRRDRRTTTMQDHTAVVTGLLGLDCVHECHTELHPVYSLALRANSNPPDPGTGAEDKWMIFVRNSGNEGDCGSDLHFLDRNDFTIFLPAPPSAGAEDASVFPTVNNQTPFLSNVKGLKWKLLKAPGGVLVQFTFESSDSACTESLASVRIHGELCLNWTSKPARSPSGCKPQKVVPPSEDDCQESPFKVGTDTRPVLQVAEDQEMGTEAKAPTWPEFNHELVQDRNEQAQKHPDFQQSLQEFLLYLRPDNMGVYYEGLNNTKNGVYGQAIGGRIALIQTFLGSVEFEGGPGWPRTVVASNGRTLNVMTSDWMGGLRVQILRPFGVSVDLKGGQIFRSASSGYQITPGFEQYSGHDPLVYAGFGIQPFRAHGNVIPLRVTVGTDYLPGTGEWIFRFTAGPQFHLKIWTNGP